MKSIVHFFTSVFVFLFFGCKNNERQDSSREQDESNLVKYSESLLPSSWILGICNDVQKSKFDNLLRSSVEFQNISANIQNNYPTSEWESKMEESSKRLIGEFKSKIGVISDSPKTNLDNLVDFIYEPQSNISFEVIDERISKKQGDPHQVFLKIRYGSESESPLVSKDDFSRRRISEAVLNVLCVSQGDKNILISSTITPDSQKYHPIPQFKREFAENYLRQYLKDYQGPYFTMDDSYRRSIRHEDSSKLFGWRDRKCSRSRPRGFPKESNVWAEFEQSISSRSNNFPSQQILVYDGVADCYFIGKDLKFTIVNVQFGVLHVISNSYSPYNGKTLFRLVESEKDDPYVAKVVFTYSWSPEEQMLAFAEERLGGIVEDIFNRDSFKEESLDRKFYAEFIWDGTDWKFRTSGHHPG